MYLKQGDIFWGVSEICLKKIYKASRKESFKRGHVLFEEGSPADSFYSLVKGRVRLSIQRGGLAVYTVSRAGEAFGWSSLIDRGSYSATADVIEDSILMVIDKISLRKILHEYPQDGFIIFRRLARTLGERLLQSYAIIADASQQAPSITHGTGQVQEEEELL